MARIYIARTTGIGSFERHVVVKMILPERAQDETSVQMFLDEARLAASLNHQNVAQVFEVGKEAGIHFLAMEYVHGQDLRALLAKAGGTGTRVPLELALTIASGAAAGLEHAHDRRNSDGTPMGIVHRDVSPSNIMIGYDGAVKLLDFGIAKARTRSVETQSGIIKGKFAYMAPEQCRGREVDRRSDVFSLGIILYEATTQHRCFRADSDFDTMHRIVTGDIVRPTRLVPGYPAALEAIVMKALAVDASERFQSAGLLLEAIEDFSRTSHMSLSTMSLGRFMREMFGDIPEPWLANGALEPPAQDRDRDKEETVSNTAGSGNHAHPRPPSPAPGAAAGQRPVSGAPPAPGARLSSATLSQGLPRTALASPSQGVPRAALPSQGPSRATSSQGIPRVPTSASASQGIPRAASPSQGIARTATPAQGVPHTAAPTSASASQGIPRTAVSPPTSAAQGIARTTTPASPTPAQGAPTVSASQAIPRGAVSASQAIPRGAVSASHAIPRGEVPPAPASQGIARAPSSSHPVQRPSRILARQRVSSPAIPAVTPELPPLLALPPEHDEAPMHLPPDPALGSPGGAATPALPDAAGAPGYPAGAAATPPGYSAPASPAAPASPMAAFPSTPTPVPYAAGTAPPVDLRLMSPKLPPLPPNSPSGIMAVPHPIGDASRPDSGPVQGALPVGTQPVARVAPGYFHPPAFGHGELPPRLAHNDLRISVLSSTRLIYIALGALLIGIIVLLVVLIVRGPGDTPAAPARTTTSATAAQPGAPDRAPDRARPSAVAATPVGAAAPAAHQGAAAAGSRRASIRLHIVSTPPGAEVSLAGKPLGTTPLDTETDRRGGTHVLTIHRVRYQDVVAQIDLGRDYHQEFTLEPLAAPDPRPDAKPAAAREPRPATREPSRDSRPRMSAAPADTDDDCQPPDRLNPFETCHGQPCKPCPAARR